MAYLALRYDFLMTSPNLSTGSLFANRYEIDKPAGSGGMGTVYRARDQLTGRTVALKLLHADMNRASDADRFAREAELLAELHHPGIVSHIAHGESSEGQRFLAMEWLDGGDLGQRLLRGPMTIADSLTLIRKVAEALVVAHRRGITHRDIKPSNLFLVDNEISKVKILDFGIARRAVQSQAMTRTGMVIGTPEYMAPEQARGSREITPAADIFSLGCVLYECLTGQPPFTGDHLAAVLVRILFEEPVPAADRRPGLPDALSALLGRLLAKDSAQRIADAADLSIELAGLTELEEPSEPALARTVALSPPKVFAESEQSLFSVVLAAPPEDDSGTGATVLSDSDVRSGPNRQALLQAISTLGASADFLASGALVLTVPQTGSAQDQAAHAARAALLIKERWPAAVVTMATGKGVVRGRTAIGEVVDAAARAQQIGVQPSLSLHSGAVIIDTLSAKLIEGRFAQSPAPGCVLLLHEEREGDASRPLLGKPTPCVGRDPELSMLEMQLSTCIEESEARVVVLTAPPGVGKSRLRHEFLRRVEKRSEPICVMVGRGDMMSAGAPYGILRSAILRLCGLGGSEPAEAQRTRLRERISLHINEADQARVVAFIGELCNVSYSDEALPMLTAARQDPKIMRTSMRRALLEFLGGECAAAPLLLVLDDLHWGDELSVSALDEALRELQGSAFLLLAIARPELHTTFPRIWHGHKLQELPLMGLSKKACERLILQVLGKGIAPDTLSRMIEQSAGNALFLEELIRSVADGKVDAQSETVLAMLQARLGRLDADPRRVVRAASVFGQTFWGDGVRALLGRSMTSSQLTRSLEALLDAEMLQLHTQSRLPDQSEFAFRHALVRDAAYSLLTESDQQAGHRLAAEFLEATGETNAAIIAEHYERCGDMPRAALCYLRAAESDLSRGNYRGALAHVERGMKCHPEGELLGRFGSIKSYVALSISLWTQISEPADLAVRLLPVGSLGWCRAVGSAIFPAVLAQDGTKVGELVTKLVAADPDADAYTTYLEAMHDSFALLVMAAPAPLLQAIQQRIDACVAKAEPTNPNLRRYVTIVRGCMATFRVPGPWTQTTELERTIQVSKQVGDTRWILYLQGGVLEFGWGDLGDWSNVRQRLSALRPTMEQYQELNTVGLWRHLYARALCMSDEQQDWALAENMVAPMLSQTGSAALFAILAQSVMARVALLRGRAEEAAALAHALMPYFPVLPVWLSHLAPVGMSALLKLGQPDGAVAIANQVLPAIPALGGLGVAEVEFRLATSEAFHAAGQPERAHRELTETLRQIQLRANDITDAFWKQSYLTRNPYCARAQKLAMDWGLGISIS